VPIYKGDSELDKLDETLGTLAKTLSAKGIRVKYDNADNKRPGFKFADYELKGVPVRLVMGTRDLADGTIEVMRRDTLEKETLPFDGIADRIPALLDEIQQNIFEKAKKRLDDNTFSCDDYEEFKERVKDGGFYLCPWDGTPETEARIKAETQATIRCVPLGLDQSNPGVDMVSGKPATCKVIIARSY
jgi:prolyl-tRNA synthetase